ncbi:MAG: hypothetical protein QW599_06265 [Nitrososphaerota archaeon]
MPGITEYGDTMLNAYIDEWGRRRINGLLEDGTRIIIIIVAPVEIIVTNDFPMMYLAEPATAKELKSKVSGATIIHITKDFPETLIKTRKAQELRSKWQ